MCAYGKRSLPGTDRQMTLSYIEYEICIFRKDNNIEKLKEMLNKIIDEHNKKIKYFVDNKLYCIFEDMIDRRENKYRYDTITSNETINTTFIFSE